MGVFFKVDDFLVMNEYTNVIEFLNRYAPEDGQLSLNWKRMSSEIGLNCYTPQPVTKSLQKSHDVY